LGAADAATAKTYVEGLNTEFAISLGKYADALRAGLETTSPKDLAQTGYMLSFSKVDKTAALALVLGKYKVATTTVALAKLTDAYV